MPPIPDLTTAEETAIRELGKAMHTLGEIFSQGDGDPALMRAAVGVVREAADLLDKVALRWEMSRVLGQ